MPRLTDEQRSDRRRQILDAARACVSRHGLEAVSMEMIIAESGLSTGAVYRHFKGKDEIIAAAVVGGTDGLLAALLPILDREPAPALSTLVGQVLDGILAYGRAAPGHAVDLIRVGLHGWSHAQSGPELSAAVRKSYRTLRARYGSLARIRLADRALPAGVDPDAVAELLTSVTLGFVAQRALLGDGEPDRHARALAVFGTTETTVHG